MTASLAVLQLEFARKMFDELYCYNSRPTTLSLLVCSSLLEQLIVLGSTQPKLLHEIQVHTTALPIDILAKICDSKRISKDIAADVTRQRACLRAQDGNYRVQQSPVYKFSVLAATHLYRAIDEGYLCRYCTLVFDTLCSRGTSSSSLDHIEMKLEKMMYLQ